MILPRPGATGMAPGGYSLGVLERRTPDGSGRHAKGMSA